MNSQNPFDPSYPWTRPGDPEPVAARPVDEGNPPRTPRREVASGASSRSRRARRHRRQMIRRTMSIAATGLAIIFFILIATDTVRLPGGSRTRFAGGVTNDEIVQTNPKQSPVRVLSATTPMRLWVAGDSLAYALGQSLGKMTAVTGVVKPTYDARVSSGLSSPQFFDWPKHAKKELSRLDPESVVYIIGANDVGVVNGSGWKDSYGKLVDQMMTTLTGPNAERHVYWIGPPTFRDKTRNEQSHELGDLMRERAATHPNVTFIDGYTVFADDKGKYQDKLPDREGKTQLVRTSDGVHFTAKGGDRLADAVFGVLDNQWQLRAQAVPGVVQTVEQTDGCCKTPSGSSNTEWLTGTTQPKSTTTTGKNGSTTTTKKPATSTNGAVSTTSSSAPATTTTIPPTPTT